MLHYTLDEAEQAIQEVRKLLEDELKFCKKDPSYFDEKTRTHFSTIVSLLRKAEKEFKQAY